MRAPRLWIALTRPDNLVAALAVAALARARFASCHLIYEQSPWWERAGWEEHRHLFASVHAMAKVRAVRGLFDAARYVRELRARQSALAALGIREGDGIVALGSTTNLANALASAYPAVPKVLCLPAKSYADAIRPASTPGFRQTTSGWLQSRFLERMGGVGRTVRLKRRRLGGDGVRLERLERELAEVFQALVVFGNDGAKHPAAGSGPVFEVPFPGLADLAELWPPEDEGSETRPARDVVFFGTPFLLVRNIDPRLYATTLNGCLDYLRRHYGGNRRLIYRPHPAETSERRLLRLRGFVSEVDLEVAELYLLKNFRRLEAVYSVASTVSRVAFNYGLDGYALWRCFPFVPPASTFFETLLGDVPAAFEIRSLDAPPVPYAENFAAGRKPGDFAHRMLAALDAARAAVPVAAEKGFARPEDSPV